MARKNTKDKVGRLDENFLEDIKDIKRKRIINGLDDPVKPTGLKRISLAIHRHEFFRRIKDDIAKADLGKRGQLASLLQSGALLITVAVVALIVVLISAIWIFGFGLMTDAITDLPNDDPTLNVSEKAELTFGKLNEAFQQLRWISFVIIFAMFMGVLVANIALRGMQIHPAFFMGYVVLSVAVVAFSIFISNTYETLQASTTGLGTALQSFTGSSFWIINLPLIITVIALIGGIPLFLNLRREAEQGGLI